MTVFSCAHELDAMLTCIYEAWASGLGYKNIRLSLEPIYQYSFLEEYVHVDADETKVESVIDAICNKISPYVYRELAYVSMAYEEDVLDNMYRILLLGFNKGQSILEMLQYQEVMRFREIRKRLGREACKFEEVVRFHAIKKTSMTDANDDLIFDGYSLSNNVFQLDLAPMGTLLYVAHIEPKSRILITLGPTFSDRMPSEHWMIIDDIHKEAIIHPANEAYYLQRLSDEEYFTLLETEEDNDHYTDLWKVFFDSIAIKERNNPRCQRNNIPIWYRKHAVEFSIM